MLFDGLCWYTDQADVKRLEATKEGSLTKHKRKVIYNNIPCRIYREVEQAPQMAQTAATVSADIYIACANEYEIKAGDELTIARGKALGKTQETVTAIAGDSTHYYEPFGAVVPGLSHQEIRLLQKEIIK